MMKALKQLGISVLGIFLFFGAGFAGYSLGYNAAQPPADVQKTIDTALQIAQSVASFSDACKQANGNGLTTGALEVNGQIIAMVCVFDPTQPKQLPPDDPGDGVPAPQPQQQRLDHAQKF